MNDLFVPTAEAAFIAGITDREINRAVDEHILPEPLIRIDNGRRFARLGAALAGFYFRSEDVYTAPLRRKVVDAVMAMLRTRGDREAILALRSEILLNVDWHIDVVAVSIGVVSVDVGSFVRKAAIRVKTLERAQELVTSDPDILGGAPVFTGTRVPVDSVLASLKKGIDRQKILDAYPFLTDEHLKAAEIYVDVRPRRGRPAKASESPHASWKLKSTRRVSPRSPRK